VIRVLYREEGAGTAASPIVVNFTFVVSAQTPPIEEMRTKLPNTVVLEENQGLGFRLKGANVRMTRLQLMNVWHSFARSNNWIARREG
jgi:hypothetical protein